MLDDCPGVSQRRKRLLLEAFGSVARLRKADAGSMAAIPGIGPKLAGEIVEFLRGR